MRFRIAPTNRLEGTVTVPGDKSISHRSIMLGSIAQGDTRIRGFLEGEDALATLAAFRAMGVPIERPGPGEVHIHGVGLHGLRAAGTALDLGNSGTAMRLMAGLLSGQVFDSVLIGDASLSARPMSRVADPLREMGALISTESGGRPPLRIRGQQRPLRGLHYRTPMASAQVKSALLLAGLYSDSEVWVSEPAPTRDHTERMLKGFGYPVELRDHEVGVTGGGSLQGQTLEVPGDFSSAAFFIVAALIAPEARICLKSVGLNRTRTGALDILRLMGADIHVQPVADQGGEPIGDITVCSSELRGIEIPVDLVPLAIDEFPVLCVAAACAKGPTRLSGAAELRVKESDRIETTASGLRSLGIEVETFADGLVIEPGSLQGGTIDSHGDHRIAMAFSIAATRASDPVTIEDCANVQTSFPNFVESARTLGIEIGKSDG